MSYVDSLGISNFQTKKSIIHRFLEKYTGQQIPDESTIKKIMLIEFTRKH